MEWRRLPRGAGGKTESVLGGEAMSSGEEGAGRERCDAEGHRRPRVVRPDAEQLEHASLLPFPESSIAGTAAAELLGNRLPLAVGAKAIEDATQHDSVGRGRTSTFVVPTNGWSRKQPLDVVPQLVLAREGRFDYLLVESTGLSEPLPGAEPRLGRRTVLTFPLLPPPQKN